jgi:hypothetical protein
MDKDRCVKCPLCNFSICIKSECAMWDIDTYKCSIVRGMLALVVIKEKLLSI